MRWRGCRMLW